MGTGLKILKHPPNTQRARYLDRYVNELTRGKNAIDFMDTEITKEIRSLHIISLTKL